MRKLKKQILYYIFLLFFIYTDKTLSLECPKPTNTGEIKGNPSGCFDLYVLAISWKPELCTKTKKCSSDELYGTYAATKLSAHGFWPQYNPINNKSAYPTYCKNSPGKDTFSSSKLSYSTWSNYLMITQPNGNFLAKHEWEKHGTCSNLTQEEYFKATTYKVIKNPGTPDKLSQYINSHTSLKNLQSLFGGQDYVVLACNYDETSQKYYLSEIYTFWDKSNIDQQIKNPGKRSNCPSKNPIYIRGATRKNYILTDT
ncbi:hypothetical protein BTJ40_07025 [Microbulbifer sp. A4B17]|uniref:ribonuclease T2 family protein n=1 Tax=Microbulbifer sp. A4B17 TaxID=359370 RepID=UPI000D52EAB6|nr:hypothetical protein [Microbulbifer sp. A4B17]AWF80580.1 hypothetical protein BTJ40_07025 [Microbulbifer sp. A4B17]